VEVLKTSKNGNTLKEKNTMTIHDNKLERRIFDKVLGNTGSGGRVK